jgi:hypothetical protein
VDSDRPLTRERERGRERKAGRAREGERGRDREGERERERERDRETMSPFTTSPFRVWGLGNAQRREPIFDRRLRRKRADR